VANQPIPLNNGIKLWAYDNVRYTVLL
jgi:hypothetical protein